jgi:hypothetical protein
LWTLVLSVEHGIASIQALTMRKLEPTAISPAVSFCSLLRS